jgi:hypothetical protein
VIATPPVCPPQALPYVTYVSSGAVTADETFSNYIKKGSGSALRSPEDQRLDTLEKLKPNWDSRGSSPPAADAISAARKWLRPLRAAATSSGSPWRAPHISASDAGEIAFEWWRGERKITVYFSGRAPEYLKVWGPHIFDQMESGEILSSEFFGTLWLWLNVA